MGENIKQLPILLIIIGIILLTCTTNPATAAANTSITLTSNNNTNLGEISETHKNITQTITIKYTHSGISIPDGTIFLKLFLANKRTPTLVTLSVPSPPEWCTISLSPTNFSMPIGKIIRAEEITKTATMTIKTDITNQKAKTTETITLQANAAANNKIPAASTSLDFSISVGFIPSLEATIINDITTPLTSNQWGNISVSFNNTSNEKIIVTINKTTDSNNYEIEKPIDFEIAQNSQITKTIPFKVNKLNTSIDKTHTIDIQITYGLASDSTETGLPITLTTSRQIQYDPEKEDALDLAPAFIGLAIILLLVIAFFSYLTLRRQ